MIEKAHNVLVVRLSRTERLGLIAGMCTLCLSGVLSFAGAYFFPETVSPRLNQYDREWGFVLMLILGLGGLTHFLFVGLREEWFRAVYRFDVKGISKLYPSGRAHKIEWEQIESVNRWTDRIKTSDKKRMFLGFYGTVGFSREVWSAIYEIAGDDALFTRLCKGQS